MSTALNLLIVAPWVFPLIAAGSFLLIWWMRKRGWA